jgi:hypothetical protein
MLGLGSLLGSDLIDHRPDARKLGFGRFVHVESVGEAESGKRHHNATDFLARFAYRATVNVIDELMRLALSATGGLDQLKSLFKEAVVTFLAVPSNHFAKASHHPRLHAALEGPFRF